MKELCHKIIGAGACQEHNPRYTNTHTQTHTHTYREREREVRQGAYVLETEERDLLMILHKIIRVLRGSLKNSHPDIYSKIGSHHLFIEEEETLKSAPGRMQKQLWSDCRSTSQSTDPSIRSTAKTAGLTKNVGRWPVDRPNGVFFLAQQVDRFQFLCMSVDRTVDRNSGIELKTPSTFIFVLSLRFLSRWRFFKSEPNSNEHQTKSTHDLGKIDTRSRLERSWRNRHTISVKSTHDLDLDERTTSSKWITNTLIIDFKCSYLSQIEFVAPSGNSL